MAFDTSPRLSMPFLNAGQAQKETFHNEALTVLDIIVQAHVESATLATPSGTIVRGQCWIVPAGATGAWTGRADSVAGWTDGGWRFVAPLPGLRVHVADEGLIRMYDGSAWVQDAVRPDGYYQGGMRVLSARQAAIATPSGGSVTDAQARTSINAILAALQAHGLIA
ncbi:MAG: DUF2793 domain-containing protein [Sphingobium sp.]